MKTNETVIKAPSRPDEAVYTYKGYYIAVGWYNAHAHDMYVHCWEGELNRQGTHMLRRGTDYITIQPFPAPWGSKDSLDDIANAVQEHVASKGDATILQPLIYAAIKRITDTIAVRNLRDTIAGILYRDYPNMSTAVVHHITSIANMDVWGEGGYALLAQFSKDGE